MDSTATVRLSDDPYLTLDGSGSAPVALVGQGLSLGRHARNGLRLNQPDVSRFHARLIREGEAVLLADLNSRNGTFVNGTRVKGTVELRHGDLITVGGVQLTFHAQDAAGRRPPPSAGADVPTTSAIWVPAAILDRFDGEQVQLVKQRTTIGRGRDNDLVLASPMVSRRHAVIEHRQDRFILTDCESANGTTVNGDRIIRPHPLQSGDEVRFGGIPFVFRRFSHLEHS